MSDAKLLELQEFIEKIDAIKGRHTELVTVLIPADYNVNAVVKQLEAERSTASNIKSRSTRNAVIEAIEKIVRELKLGPQKYPKGIAIYCGNVSQDEGVPDIQYFSVEPPQELRVRIYRCDQEFVTEPLKEMVEINEVFGLLAIDRKEATIGLLEGTQIKVLQKMTSGVPSKIRAGGQSSQRFARITEGMAKEFFRRVAEAMKEHFFEMKKLKGILVGGPIPTKDEFLEEGQLVTALKNKVIGVKDIGYADEHGLQLLVESSKDVLAEQQITKEKKIIENFFNTLGKNPDKAAYGYEKVKRALNMGAVQTLIVSEKVDRDILRELSKIAEQMGTEIEIVSAGTGEGEQFFNLSGIGAVLRFAV
ncbi:MAG: peptide chain release factor aRF-1 [Candidatus Pacearchaeota archaeon]|jgi:peptide chain release factor subunit 1